MALVSDLIEPALDREVPGPANDPRRYVDS